MTFLDTVALAIANLWRRKTRTLLTVLGVIIGTACIVIMVALGLGSLEQFTEQILQNEDLTKIQVYSGYGNNAPKLNAATLEQCKQIEGVKSATGLLNLPAFIKMGKYQCSSGIIAVDPDAMDFEFSQGKVFPNNDTLEFVIGQGAMEWFSDPHQTQNFSAMAVDASYDGTGEESQEPPGPKVDWLDQQLIFYPSYSDGSDYQATPDNPLPEMYKARFCGILAPSNSETNYNIYCSMDAAKKIIRENRKLMANANISVDIYSSMIINAKDIDSVQGILDTVKEMGFEAYSPTEWINQMKDEFGRQQSQLIAIGLISLLVSAIGIANTMLASILERRKEIGVMKVIGLSINKINLMFLVEAALIGLIGGLIALVVCYTIAGVVNTGYGAASFLGIYFQDGVRLTIPWWLSLGAIGISTGVGIISGLYPAHRATKMSPLEAIRGSN